MGSEPKTARGGSYSFPVCNSVPSPWPTAYPGRHPAYAGFGVQVRAVLAVPAVDGLTMEHATAELTRLVPRGCGLAAKN